MKSSPKYEKISTKKPESPPSWSLNLNTLLDNLVQLLTIMAATIREKLAATRTVYMRNLIAFLVARSSQASGTDDEVEEKINELK